MVIPETIMEEEEEEEEEEEKEEASEQKRKYLDIYILYYILKQATLTAQWCLLVRNILLLLVGEVCLGLSQLNTSWGGGEWKSENVEKLPQHHT